MKASNTLNRAILNELLTDRSQPESPSAAITPDQGEAPGVDAVAAWLGSRVRITKGAWRGECGQVTCAVSEDCYMVKLDGRIELSWGTHEMERLPNSDYRAQAQISKQASQ